MLLPYLVDIISQLLPVAVRLLQALMPILEVAFKLLEPILNLVLSLIDPLLNIITGILTPISALLSSLIAPNGPLTKLTPVLQGLADLLTGVLGTSLEFIFAKIDVMITVFQGLIDFISKIFVGDWEGAWETVVDTFGSVFEGIVNVAKVPINAIIKMLNSAIDGINSIKIPDWVPGVGGSNLNLKKLPLLAKGGVADEQGMAIVGDAGPELLSLPAGASVHPLTGQNALIDYDKLGAAIVMALKIVAPEFATNVRIEGNMDGIVEALVEENQKSIISSGRALFA
jgi:phage-related protein